MQLFQVYCSPADWASICFLILLPSERLVFRYGAVLSEMLASHSLAVAHLRSQKAEIHTKSPHVFIFIAAQGTDVNITFDSTQQQNLDSLSLSLARWIAREVHFPLTTIARSSQVIANVIFINVLHAVDVLARLTRDDGTQRKQQLKFDTAEKINFGFRPATREHKRQVQN